MQPQLSIVIPVLDERESLPELVEWIDRVVKTNNLTTEVILIDDGSKDGSWQVMQQLKASYPYLHALKFRRNYGKSAALNVGFGKAAGAVVLTMDADLQDSPDEIPALYALIASGDWDLVSGYKKVRYDPWSKTIPSKFFNWFTRQITGIKLSDFNCGLKAYQWQVVKSIEVYGEMHRYIPVLVQDAGFTRISQRVVVHRPRKYGHTKFGWERFVNGFLDLLSITFVLRFRRRPMHFFGMLGTLSFLSGFVLTSYLIWEKLHRLQLGEHARNVTDQPLFYLALIAIVVGTQLFLAGFLGELISRSATDRNLYLIDAEI